MMKIRRRVGRKPASVQLFTICAEDWARRIEVLVAEKAGSGGPGKHGEHAEEADRDDEEI